MIEFRVAEARDAEALLEHINTVAKETDNLSFGADTFSISVEKEARFIKRFYDSDKEVMYVAIDGNIVVGNAVVERERIRRYSHRGVISITVLKDYWGQGIGSRLMELMIDFAIKSGIEILSLEVRADNVRATSLYKKFGFEEIGTFKGFFKIENKYYDAILMQLVV